MFAPWPHARRLRSLCLDSGTAPKGASKAEQLRLEEELVKTRTAKMKKLNEDFQVAVRLSWEVKIPAEL